MKVHITGKSIPEVGRWTICGLIVCGAEAHSMVGRIHVIKGEPFLGKAPKVTCGRCRKIYNLT